MNQQGKKPIPTSSPSPVVRRLRFDLPHRAIKPPHASVGKEPRDGR